VLETSRIVASLPDALAALASEGLQTAPLTFVSGPSATSDIEFSRVEGVHGPRRLEIVIVRN
jgi:L-lactate dehydrogenase complex protein LldG